MNSINIDEIQFSPTIRLWDPNGRVFFYNGKVYRGIYDHRKEFVKKLFSDGIINNLMEKNLLVGTYLTDLKLEGFGLVLQHDKIDIDIKPGEWSLVTFIEAAKQYIRIVKELHKNNLILIDAHHGNFSLYYNGLPVWHDFGSIVEPSKRNLSAIMCEFMEYYYNPLMYYQKIKSFAIIRNFNLYLSNEDYHKMMLTPILRSIEKYKARLPGLILKNDKRAFLSHILKKLIMKRSFHFDSKSFINILDAMHTQIDSIKVDEDNTKWANYHDKFNFELSENEYSPREAIIADLIKKLNPDKILDLGANQGFFSHLVHKHCPVVITSDYDHASVAKHAKRLFESNKSLRIYPVIINVLKMSDDEMKRYRCHTVLALALTHHLRLGQGYPFHHIAKLFADLTEQYLITEYMPNGLGVGEVQPDPLPDDYSLDNLQISLKKHFRSVEVIEYARDTSVSPRHLILCGK